MGVQLRDIAPVREVLLQELSGKKVAVDGFNTLYQFLTIIRQRDGTPLMDSHGRITSHLSGLLYRTAKLLENGIRPCFVFDGKPPEFKLVLREREERKKEAREKLKEAIEEGNAEKIRRYSQQAVKLESYMIEDAKKLLTYLGIPWVQAPSEGEAQAAYMAEKGDVWATGSQDFDALLFGTPRLVRNLTITGRRKLPRKDYYIEIRPELIELEEMLSELGIDRDGLITIGILAGTDFNPGGIKGVGPKKALELVKRGKTLEELITGWNEEWPPAKEIFEFFKNPPHTDSYSLEWREPREDRLIEFLVEEHDFSRERVVKTVSTVRESLKKGAQSNLSQWF